MTDKPSTANFFPDVPDFPSMGAFQPVYGKFDLTTYIQGASDYEIMAFLVGKYNACLEAYGTVTKLSADTVTACKQLQDWINTWFTNLDVQEELNNKIDSMVKDGSFSTLLHQTFDTQINQQTTNAVTAWLVKNVTPTGSAVVVDKSLSVEGAAADAKTVGTLSAVNHTKLGTELTDANINNSTGYYTSDYNSSLHLDIANIPTVCQQTSSFIGLSNVPCSTNAVLQTINQESPLLNCIYTINRMLQGNTPISEWFFNVNTNSNEIFKDGIVLNLLNDVPSVTFTTDYNTPVSSYTGYIFNSDNPIVVTSLKPSVTTSGYYYLFEVYIDNKTTIIINSSRHSTDETVKCHFLCDSTHGFAIEEIDDTKFNYSVAKNPLLISTTNDFSIINQYHIGYFAGTFTYKNCKLTTTTNSINYLYGTNIIAIGDSMVKGHSLADGSTWLHYLSSRNKMTKTNAGTNGAYMSDYQYSEADNSVYQKVCVPTSAMYISNIDNYNYIVIYAGTNDCQANITIGDIDSTDPKEFCGAINAVCTALQTNAPMAKIMFITPYLRAGIEERSKLYANAIKNVCAKYSIPVFDNTIDGGICWSNSAQVNALTLKDTYHLNATGQEYVSYKYEAKLRTL